MLDGGVGGEKALSRASRLEPLHPSLYRRKAQVVSIPVTFVVRAP